jgi:hypothetical protein
MYLHTFMEFQYAVCMKVPKLKYLKKLLIKKRTIVFKQIHPFTIQSTAAVSPPKGEGSAAVHRLQFTSGVFNRDLGAMSRHIGASMK